MRVRLDRTKCQGYGTCAEECPSLFELDEFGYAQLKVEDGAVPEGDEDRALAAERACPERAITHED
jgi:ferredoxin